MFSFARYSQKCVTQIYRALYGDAMFVSCGGTQTNLIPRVLSLPREGTRLRHKYGTGDVTKTSVIEFCY